MTCPSFMQIGLRQCQRTCAWKLSWHHPCRSPRCPRPVSHLPELQGLFVLLLNATSWMRLFLLSMPAELSRTDWPFAQPPTPASMQAVVPAALTDAHAAQRPIAFSWTYCRNQGGHLVPCCIWFVSRWLLSRVARVLVLLWSLQLKCSCSSPSILWLTFCAQVGLLSFLWQSAHRPRCRPLSCQPLPPMHQSDPSTK